MKQHGVGGLPVVDNANRVLAIVTEKDLLNVFEGKARGIKVVALMTKEVVTGTGETTIIEAARKMVGKSFRRLPLVSGGRLVGIVTAMDIVRFFGSGEVFQHLRSGTILQVLQTPALQIGTEKLVTTSQDADVTEAARTMKERNVGALLVVDDGKLVGMLTERDFFKLASRV
jgi:CBS domain-containing protein